MPGEVSGSPSPSSSSSTAVGLCLLPSDLLHEIFFRLALPELLRLRSVSRSLSSIISASDFRHLYSLRHSSDPWLFIFKKRPPRTSTLLAFSSRSARWLRLPLSAILPSAHDDLYFLAASGDFLLFASNTRRQLLAVNLAAAAVRPIPASPLGPRGTSSWRRSGLKLVAGPPGSDGFRFLFAELLDDRPLLFAYSSDTDTWRSAEAAEATGPVERTERVFLSAAQRRRDSVIISSTEADSPTLYRPRYNGENPAVGFLAGGTANRLHVYGDGRMAVIGSDVVDLSIKMRMITTVEVWGLSSDGRDWDLVSRVPRKLIERIKKPFEAMTGCLEERAGVVRVVLVSNYKGLWALIWLCYDLGLGEWKWVPVPDDDGTHGLNMAGIAFSSALRLRSFGS